MKHTTLVAAGQHKHDLPIRMKGIWPKLILAYQIAKAAYELANAERRYEEAEVSHDRQTMALDAILLTPAEHGSDLRFKIELMAAEDIADGWWCAQEAIALLAIDANRLLPYAREGGPH